MPPPPPPPRGAGWRAHAPQPPPNTEMALPAKPWQSDYLLRTETQLRDSLKSASKRSRTAEDLERYRRQRAKVSELEMQLMCLYFRNNPGREEFWLPLLAMEAAQSGRNHCDVCETGFESEAALFHHEEHDHDICGLEGCTVTGSASVLEEHALLIHSSGLYRRMKGGMSDEEVAGWREERRKNWPTREKGEAHREKLAQKRRRIASAEARKREEYELERAFRQEAKEEARMRAAVERERRAAEKREENALNAECKPMRAGKARRNKDPAPFPRWSDDSEDEGTCDGIPMFRGTARFADPEGRGGNEAGEQRGKEMTSGSFDISDDEIMVEEETRPKAEELKIVVVDDDDDSEPPQEIKVKKQPETAVSASPPQKPPATLKKQCNMPDGKNLPPQTRKLDEESLPPQMALRRRIFRLRMRQTWRQEGPAPSTLLERLLEKDIATERTELLQCVKYVCENNFFGVGDVCENNFFGFGDGQMEQDENSRGQCSTETKVL